MLNEHLLDGLLLLLSLSCLYLSHQLNRKSNYIDPTHEVAKNGDIIKKPSFTLLPSNLIRRAGFMPERIIFYYWVGKLFFAIQLSVLTFYFYPQLTTGFYISSAFIGWWIIDIWLYAKKKSRAQSMRSSLSFFLDMVWTFTKSGIELGRAFKLAGSYGLKHNEPLAHEMKLLVRELDAGASREVAFKRLAERTDLDEIRSLSAVVSLGLRVGTPMSELLEAQASASRIRDAQRGREVLQKKSLIIMFPMMLASLPMFLVIVFFPTAVQIAETYSIFKLTF